MSRTPTARASEGWEGWDAYAPFYDWENAQTMGRRDVEFWQRLARKLGGPVLELGCGTGRLALPVGRAAPGGLVGIDRSEPMLARARQRVRRGRLAGRVRLLRGDIRHLPFQRPSPFSLVMAPYGMLQSLLKESDLKRTLESVASILEPGAVLGADLVADLPAWKEYRREQRLSGWRPGKSAHVTLIESVRQDREKGLTIFEQEYVERRGTTKTSERFDLAFRTLTVPQMARRIEKAGFKVTAVLGDYDGGPWDPRAETWLILAERR